MAKTLKTILALLLISVVFVFAVQNLATVEISFLTWSASLPRALIYFTILALGIVIGRLLDWR